MTVLVKHDMGCPMKGQGHSDAAKRVYDTYHLHRIAGVIECNGKWFAAALNDGSTDGVLYDSKSDAVRHQHHNEMYYTYIQVTMANMTVCSAEVMLNVARRMYDKGIRMVDPDHRNGGPDVIRRLTWEDQRALARGQSSNLITSGE